MELSICPLEGSREHAFQITGVWGCEWSQPQEGEWTRAVLLPWPLAGPQDTGKTMSELRGPAFSSNGSMGKCQAGVESSSLGGPPEVPDSTVSSSKLQPWGPHGALGRGLPRGLLVQPALHPPPIGPLPAPLLVLCPSQAELDRWLYHLEKQMALAGGLRRCNSAPPQVSASNSHTPSNPPPLPALTPLYQGPPEDELPWTLQRRLTRLRTGSGRQVVGSAICASRVKLQHLPSQVGRGNRGEEMGVKR